jgi:hypothetical protein
MRLGDVLYEDARLAYTVARGEVFDLAGWTPTAVLTAQQADCLDRLSKAETLVHLYRRGHHTA